MKKNEMMAAMGASNITDLMAKLGVIYEKNKYKVMETYYSDFDQALEVAFNQPKFESLKTGAISAAEFDNQEFKKAITEKRFSSVPEGLLKSYASDNVLMTTSQSFHTVKILSEFSVVTADCVYGMNIFRDVFASVRNLVGGRSGAVEKLLIDGKKEVSDTLKYLALLAGGNALIAVTFNYQVIGDSSTGSMIAIYGSGTPVKISLDSLS